MQRKQIGVFFGGQSPEHEVSVITGLQVVAALDPSQFDVTPVYVTKDGHWFIGNNLGDITRYADIPALLSKAREVALASGPGRTLALVERKSSFIGSSKEILLDVAFLAFHGGSGENGAVQGLCETLNVPFTGSGIAASALGMDKVLSKKMCQMVGVPVVDWLEVWEYEWRGREAAKLEEIESQIGFPAIVKPVRLGSSIGIARVVNQADLDNAIEEAFRYDASVMIEKCVPNLREINCSVLGDGSDCQVSVLEEPVSKEGILSFKDKYMRDGLSSKSGGSKSRGSKSRQGEGMASLDRLIPAPISQELGEEISKLARQIFKALNCSGVVRIDFLMDDALQKVWFNEINTIPGSFSFYLWQPTGLPFEALVQKLVELAISSYENRSGRVRSYDVNLLATRSKGGLKGGKS
ncbi:MAG: D-alanine--D-alanine ligase [Bacteroidetes bacterium]|nr:D-alanine--D-alanine ligase [Bacteroidota bacterium]